MIYILFGIFILVFLCILCYFWYRQDGILFFADYNRIGCLIWLLGLGFYDLSLSSLYKPNWIINVVTLLVIFNFLLLSFKYKNNIKQVYKIYNKIQTTMSRESFLFLIFILILGLVSFAINIKIGSLRFFSANKGKGHQISFSYFLNMMIPISLIFYICARNDEDLNKKIFYFILSFFSLFLIFCNLSRGPILYWIFGVVIFELFNYFKKINSWKFNRKHIILLLAFILVFVWGFGFIGEIRTAGYGWISTNDHYNMKVSLPTGLTWVYVYISSPLENLRDMLTNQFPRFLQYGNNLFYPFIKAGANLLGKSGEYVNYLEITNTLHPYLSNDFGLNVSSFIADSYLDFGYFGLFIYLIFYDVISIFYSKFLYSKKVSNISKAVIIPIIIQITLWSIFDNSIFRIIIIWIDIAIVFTWDFLREKSLNCFKKGSLDEKK